MKYSLSRYERHIDLPNFGAESQNRLKESKVCIIGAGGLGCPVALYLAGAGIGHLTLVDSDVVSLSNLQRQVLYREKDIGKEKVALARDRVLDLNPEIQVGILNERASPSNLAHLFLNHHIIVDCSDNFETRYLLNEAAYKYKKTLISGAVIHYDGQVFTFKGGHPCYACLFPTAPTSVQAPTCTESAVLGPIPGVIGTLMCAEIIKEICTIGVSLAGSFLSYSALDSECHKISFVRNEECQICCN